MPFRSTNVPFEKTGKFTRLFLDYISGDPKLSAFQAFAPDADGYRKAADALKYEEKNRAVVADAILRQYAQSDVDLPADLFRDLSEPGTLTVCTGHQLCLFTGPLYFVYKILSTIRLAEFVARASGKKVVPVYWMASEDHDFAEIASVNLFGKTLTWEKPGNGAVGNLRTDSLQALPGELKVLMGESPAAVELHALFAKAYRPGRPLSDATRELVHELTGGKILVLDGNDVELKKLFVPYFKADFFEQIPFREVNATIAELEKAGYEAQVNPREINVFYLGKNFRERIGQEGSVFRVVNTEMTFTAEELESELQKHPEKFSPNVVLRPLYQQVLLPNIAYTGGPGELAYWLEYKRMFDHFAVTFPVLQPRHSALLIDRASAERMQKLGITVEDLFTETEALVKKVVASNAGGAISLSPEKEELESIFSSIAEKAAESDPTLRKNAEAELQKALNSLENLEAKMLRAHKQKQETSVAQVRKLHEKLFPGGGLQERYDNFIPYYLKYGHDFIALLEEQFRFPVSGMLVLGEAGTGAFPGTAAT